jgi:hypothetical protein
MLIISKATFHQNIEGHIFERRDAYRIITQSLLLLTVKCIPKLITFDRIMK